MQQLEYSAFEELPPVRFGLLKIQSAGGQVGIPRVADEDNKKEIFGGGTLGSPVFQWLEGLSLAAGARKTQQRHRQLSLSR
jgi:hypothetical protein